MALTVVTGPPCSGKSTYIRDRARPADIVIDLDRIALALAAEGTGDHDYPDHVRTVARAARNAAIDAALKLHRAAGIHIWVIDTNPTPAARAYYRRHGATTFISLTVTDEEIEARLADRPPRNQALVRRLTRPKRKPLTCDDA